MTVLATAAGPRILSASPGNRKMHIAVIGAGAFGGWTALQLLRKGARVTLVDAWGPGNSRASSGGETRVIRGVYGKSQVYVKWAARSMRLWQENEKAFQRKVYFKTGALWFIHENEDYVNPSLPFLDEEKLAYEKFTTAEAQKRYPQINLDGIRWVLLEKEAGILLARQSCQAVQRVFVAEGGEYRNAMVRPGAISSKRMESVPLQDGSALQADQFVFACGPWLHKMFPDLPENLVQPTRQEVFFFGIPPGDSRFTETELPVWVDFGEKLIYGIPGNEFRGFKVADDSRGKAFDPTSDDRIISSDGLNAARAFLAHRFPLLKEAPLVESRVCQYENSPDGHFLIDRHPAADNVWIIGGGSGHGFKHGPALGEYAASLIHDGAAIDPFFSISRFRKES